MTVTPSNALQLAKQGDAQSVADLINRALKPKDAAAKVVAKDGQLQIMLEAQQVPEQMASTDIIRETLTALYPDSPWQVKVYGREIGEDFPAWNETFALDVYVAPDLSTLAKQGDLAAITELANEWLNIPDIVVKASLKQNCLQILLEAPQAAPDEQIVVAQLRQRLQELQVEECQRVKLLGREAGEDFPTWQQEFDLSPDQSQTEPQSTDPSEPSGSTDTPNRSNSFWGSLLGSTANAAGAIGGAVASAGSTVAGAVTSTAGAVGGAAASAGQSVAGAVTSTAGAVGGAAVSAGSTVAGIAVGASGAVTTVAMQVPGSVAYILEVVNQSPGLASLTQALKVDWLMNVINQVDVVAAETRVKQLRQQHPQERSDQIARRIMLEKSLYVGGSGFASSIMPGIAVGLFAVDLLATTALQAEMVYQIACAYGLDLSHSDRKGEVLAIFGLALGGNTALKAGFGFLRNVPIAGAVIGASTNAVTLYAVGYAACRFYEAKINPTTSSEVVADAQLQSEQYLHDAIAQQVIMDQILAHVVAAGSPGKTWEQILPELQTLNFSPVSLQVIAKNLQSPTPLEKLLEQMSQDFMAPLVAQCQKVAQLDGITTPEEAKVIETITKKLDTSLQTAFSTTA